MLLRRIILTAALCGVLLSLGAGCSTPTGKVEKGTQHEVKPLEGSAGNPHGRAAE